MLKSGATPGPLTELEFWAAKAANLNAIHDQLNDPKIVKVMQILELAKSTYHPGFDRLCREVSAAREEANDNVKFLAPLSKLFEKLNMADDFPMLVELFKPIMHTLMLVWKHSKYYNTAARLVVLMREICNDLIMQACKNVDGATIFENPPQESVDKLRTTLKVCKSFKSFYFEYNQLTAEQCPDNPWRFQNSALFSRLDAFMERCDDIQDLSLTMLQFGKLERVEIGGTKGRALTASVRQIFTDFQSGVDRIKAAQYDILDVGVKQFDDDFYAFRLVIKELERRLASVITQAFDDCTTVGTTFKLLDSFEGLLDREIIQADLERKHMDLLRAYGADLKEVNDIFHSQMAAPTVNKNNAPNSGAVAWVRALKERVQEPMERVKELPASVTESEEGQEITKLYGALSDALLAFEQRTVEEWAAKAEETGEERLKQSLLIRDDSAELPFLAVNFDPMITRLLREVKYFLLLSVAVPAGAEKIFKRGETLRQQTGNLELITGIYNDILSTLLPVERPLIEKKLEAVDAALTKGLTVLNWNSHHIDEYIAEVMSQVKEVDSILKTIKSNVESTIRILAVWSKKLMFDRKEGKTYSVEEFREFNRGIISARHQEIQTDSVEITRLLSASNKTLKASKGSNHWRSYVEYVNDIVMDGFCSAILTSVTFMFQQLDPEMMAKNDTPPLLEVGLELAAPEIVWQPEIGQDGQGSGVRDLFNGWIKGFLHIGTLMKRLDIGEGNYVLELEEDFQLMDAISAVQNVVLANERACIEFKNSFQKYDYLWKQDLAETLQEFLAANLSGDGDVPQEKFDVQISKYKALQEEIQAMPSGLSIGWIKINAQPLKHALLTWVNKWVNLYTNYLSNKVVSTMEDLYAFMNASSKVLETADPAAAELDKEDAQRSLYEVMATMRDIRKRADKTDNMVEPLRATVALLKTYGVSIPDATLKKLEEGPMAWADLKKKSLNMRERLAQQQQDEARIIRQKSDDFQVKVEQFRAEFLKQAPFAPSGPRLELEHVQPAYEVLDAYRHGEPTEKYQYGSVTVMVAEGRSLNEAQELFEIYTVDYIALRRCEEEMTALKSLWDMIGCVMYQFVEWNFTPWDKIDVDFLVEEAKKLQKDIKGLNKAVRNFEAYKVLEDQVKALLTSLPLVSDLHHPSMRDRHWKLLMKTTNKQFVMDEKFNLGNLLALELHECVDAVSEIVERAQKELVIEKALTKIDETWAALDLSFSPFHDSEVMNILVDDLITETLEADNLTLQTMSSGKYVQGNPKFLEMVTTWQKKLGTVDSVLNVWKDVCRKWQALESIFVGSADIRVQLPEDSKRFDAVNVEFIALMASAPDILNVVEACNMDGRGEQLDNMLTMLELCEKALQDYLETKRIAFPRFYFVAPADLLDILSKGTNPQLILKHLAKCFDNVHNLEFTKNDAGAPTKMAIGMYSGEKEYVLFDGNCSCDGPVEVWLQNVVDSMRQALMTEFKTSIISYDEKPRTKWLFDQSTPNTVMITRVFFTQEMNETFDQMEEGNDGAMKDFYQKQVLQLAGLIELINGELTKNDRKKIVTLCTIDVHARDVVQRLIDARVESATCFEWASQLRYSQNEKTMNSQINICDAEVAYGYEYTGNCGCLVITPLTDRCYITLTQAQRLVLGGAPAGPAGTGKTETVKDLGRALGYQVYVFNCSDQMDYRAMGQTYKGLAQTGAWGCFDEFNRIPVAVLSVCSTQYKTVLDAIRSKKQKFMFEDVEIGLRPTCMAFITMNPGYPGRAELPESLKALFRPVSMCVPDLNLICEIMLMAEGFLMSKILARKFVILYKLCEDLLSKAPHYDWKLRAIKTTLYVAGGLKRGQPHLSEDKVLLQALRDFNLGKLTSDDHGIFMGLLNDLFPKTVDLVPRRVDKVFEEEIKKAARELNYQPEETFALKITQLREIFEVRWSVFLLGPAGCGKTAVWRTLMRAQNNSGEKTQAKPINPKSVTRNELYGFLHPSTREWKEGLISVTYRDMSNNTTFQHQWIVLDGDIDAEWIESMNTVMDDNKMLTLASNERIPLSASMRLLLEINHMVHCSPATVSRGGVIYLNADDIGWSPVVESWIQAREDKAFRPLLTELFDKYVEKSMEHCRRNFKTLLPLVPVNIAQTICKILESMLPAEAVRGGPPPDRKLLEAQFVFACVWAIGGCMLVDKVVDFRTQFSKWWMSEWKSVFYPDKGVVFDYYVDEKTSQMVHWEDKVPSFTYGQESFANMFVPSVETTRLGYFLGTLTSQGHYVMFVGNAGTGKTALMRDKLRSMDPETNMFSTLNFNNFMDASSLQVILEQPLEKKSGVRFGPPGARKLIYFIDDMNMPFVDKYDTQSPIELARQFVDYRGWYDKVKIVLKEVLNCYYTACMNPTAGSFNITPRMQRHFATFAVQMPGAEIIRAIYLQLVEGHMRNFDPDVSRLAPKIVDATVELHRLVSSNFLPSAVKFHYQFNLRDLSNIAQGLCRMPTEYYNKSLQAVRLWVHEVERVYLDRMVNGTDISRFEDMRLAVTKKFFDDENIAEVEARPNIHNSFMKFTPDETGVYYGCDDYGKLNKVLVEKLTEHNETRPVMDLVLFNQAMEHICRICRIVDLPRGNAMLVGVGGSGKQSLAKLSAFICQYEVFQISVTSSYSVADFKVDLLNLYTKTGVKSIPMMFLMTDGQIVNERFLVYINDLLSSGYIPDLMTPEERDTMAGSVRNEVKQAGIVDSNENCWDFFLEKVRRLLHVVLCFSPVGDKFRIRARNFPALINNTAIDWFQPWPHEALISVAGRFLEDVADISPEVMENMQQHMAFVHMSVTEASQQYLEQIRRFNYTTPKSYLELISLYKQLLDLKRADLKAQRERLENGVEKIASASAQVADLQTNLKQEQIIVEEKKAATDVLIISIGQEKAVVDEAVASGKDDEEACAAIASEVMAFQAECEQDLKAAEPVIAEAEAALNSLDKKSLGELKSFGSPAAEVVQVASACMVLTAPGGKIPKDVSWNSAKKMMGNVDGFLKSLIDFDKDNTPENCVACCEKEFLSNPNFNPDFIRNKSGAAAGLCGWVVNICKYFRIYQVVAPKRALLAEANKKLDNANKKLSGIRSKVKELQDRVTKLEEGLMKATEDKNAAIAAADKTLRKAGMADRLVNGLSGENKRWGAAIELFGAMERRLVGDVLLAAAFVSYAGPFNAHFRRTLVFDKWMPDVKERQIPMTEGMVPLDILTNDAKKALWGVEGLPTDPLSIENGAIMTNAARWSLMIDPQLQGIAWIRSRETKNGLKIIQLSQAKYIDTVEYCIENGIPLLIENLQDDIDAVLDPVVARQTIKRGRNLLMKLGDKEVSFDPNFRLYLQTKLSNPHYKPEIAAQTTLVNFCVTEKGLEDQLLALVVEKERPDLQEQAAGLVRALGEYTIQLKELEDNLLFRLANSKGDILDDIELIENLEETKRTAVEIEAKVLAAKETEKTINVARESYRPVAARGSLVYFLIDALWVLDRVYQYSMGNFVYILKKGIDVTPGGPDESRVPEAHRMGEVSLEKRVSLLVTHTTFTAFSYIASGLFERHKLIVAAQLVMAILKQRNELSAPLFNYLLKGPKVLGHDNPLSEWVLDSTWASVQALREVDDYQALSDDLVGSAKRWREWMELERPEDEPMPGDWKKMTQFQQLLLFRALRPDRMSNALAAFVKTELGPEYITSLPFNLERSFEDATNSVPIFVFLSPGVDVAAAVEAMGRKKGYSYETGKYAAVSLGQGQEPIAMNNLNNFRKDGGWVLLQNIHLTIDWTNGPLEKVVDKLSEGTHEDFRLFLSAEPPPSLERGIAISVLQNSIKLTNEPPEGMKPNLLRAYNNFSEEMFEACAKQAEFKAIVFALCYFHAALLERKKFGVGNLPGATSGIGWNMNYPFNTGDLLCCAQCANNYLENNSKVPWDDLKYIFGEIMYGGHIVEDWDRRLAEKYLESYMREELLEGIEFFPRFSSPPSGTNHKMTLEYIVDTFPTESPLAFGLHPNAEIGFKLREAESLCLALLSLQPRESGGEAGASTEDKAKMVLDDVMERLPENFDLEDIRGRVDEVTPYVMVAIQEVERMNILLAEMKRSLAELDLGLKGDLTMTDPMEVVMKALAGDLVPPSWARVAWPSLRPLGSWLQNLQARITQLSDWTADLTLPKVTWLSGLFNPQSFLTAVMQTTARRNDWPLDKTVVLTEVTKKQVDQIEAPSRDGAFIHGLTLEGARWDDKTGVLDDSKPKELFCPMPVILIKAVTVDKAEMKDAYQTPVYKTERRFREEVFTAQLKSKHGTIKWTLAGVCLFLDVV